jgi:hypothetical protein
MRCAQLHPNTRLPFGHHRKKEPYYINTFFQDFGSEILPYELLA